MIKHLSIAAALTVTIFAGFSYSRAENPRTLETVATIPSNGFNENLFQASDGSIYVTGAFEGNLWKITTAGHVEKFATFPDHATILGIVGIGDGLVLGAHRRGFQTPSGADFSDLGSEVLMLDKNGNIAATIPGNDGDVFNGTTLDGRGKILITDSLKSSIWQFDPGTQKLSLWVKDDVLSSPSVSELGANGIKVVNGWVYVANRSKFAVYKIRIDENGDAQGPFSLVADGLPVADDFAVGPDGTVYMPPAEPGAALIRISPDGKVDSMLESAPFGSSAIVTADGKWLYWATSREPKEQRLVRVAIP
jgi:sugar lactone lactonase YvrE